MFVYIWFHALEDGGEGGLIIKPQDELGSDY